MKERNAIKYKFSINGARKGRAVLQILVNNKYLDRNGDLKKVQSVLICPFNIDQLQTFLREPNLMNDYDEIIRRYDGGAYGLLLFLESADGRLTNYTIEEFQLEFGIPPFVMEMVLDHNEGKGTS